MGGDFVAVIGTVNRDVVVAVDGTRSESLGGILYSAFPLAAILEGSGIAVRVFARLGADDRDQALTLSRAFPALDSRGLLADPAGTNLSWLDYSRSAPGSDERWERVELRVPPLNRDDLAAADGARAVLVNMISGRDVPRAVLEELRQSSGAPFLLDVQAMTRGAEVPRRPQTVADWRQWAALFDIVRGNEEEIGFFADYPGDPTAGAHALLGAGAETVLVTRGERGVHVFRRDGRDVVAASMAAWPLATLVDPTGCGDAFLAGVCAGQLLGDSPREALRRGAHVAAEVAGLSGLEALQGLVGIRARFAEVMRERSGAWELEGL